MLTAGEEAENPSLRCGKEEGREGATASIPEPNLPCKAGRESEEGEQGSKD